MKKNKFFMAAMLLFLLQTEYAPEGKFSPEPPRGNEHTNDTKKNSQKKNSTSTNQSAKKSAEKEKPKSSHHS